MYLQEKQTDFDVGDYESYTYYSDSNCVISPEYCIGGREYHVDDGDDLDQVAPSYIETIVLDMPNGRVAQTVHYESQFLDLSD